MDFESNDSHLPMNFETTNRVLSTQISFLPAIGLHSIAEYLENIKMSRRRGRDYEHVDYTKLSSTDHGFVDAQFVVPPPKIPWKAVIFATILLIGGTVLLTLGVLVVTGYIDTKYADRMWPMIILGILMFIPGSYHTRIAYYAYKKVPGYSFDDIPEFE